MYSGAQISLYPMTSDFVPLILSSLSALDPYRPHLKIDTDDISTLLIGPPGVLFSAIRDLFVAASKNGDHVCLHALISRGCPGGQGDDVAFCERQVDAVGEAKLSDAGEETRDERIARAKGAVVAASKTGQTVAAQFAYYPLGETQGYMSDIYAAIDFIADSGTLERTKNFCTKLRGDAGEVLETLHQVFVGFAGENAHIALDVTLSANSPTKTK